MYLQGRRKVQKSRGGGQSNLTQDFMKSFAFGPGKIWGGGNWTPCSDGSDFLVLTDLEDTPLQSPQAWPQIMMLLQIKGNAFIDS